jgi:hypothetical protein
VSDRVRNQPWHAIRPISTKGAAESLDTSTLWLELKDLSCRLHILSTADLTMWGKRPLSRNVAMPKDSECSFVVEIGRGMAEVAIDDVRVDGNFMSNIFFIVFLSINVIRTPEKDGKLLAILRKHIIIIG